MQPILSVVVPTHDRLRYLKEAVASIRSQTFSSWELFIIDDASQDDTQRWLQTISDPRIRFARTVRQLERSAARNLGLEAAGGEFAIFLDDDDRFRPRAFEMLVDAFARHPECAVVCGTRIEFDETGHRRRAPHVRIPQLRALWPEVLGGWVAGPGEVMYRTEKLRSIGGWDESLTGIEDWELILRASYRLGPVYMHPQAVREWRRHPAQWTHAPKGVQEALSQVGGSFIESLPPGERPIGEGALRLRELFVEAQIALHTREDPASALRLFIAAYRSAPAVARSPMFRLRFARGISQASFARAGGRHTQRLLETGRRMILQRLRLAPGQPHATPSDPDVADE